ncbi:hypothetical protein C8Q74DRAFT_1187806, partial [Fomes fomentarius]
GDAIVWWRAWVLWKNRRAVQVLGVIMLLATAASAIFLSNSASSTFDETITTYAGALFGGDGWGTAAAILSLVTNLVATSLIGLKAWQHRRLVRAHLTQGTMRTQVERTLLLLVESGLLYCTLWVRTSTSLSKQVTTHVRTS